MATLLTAIRTVAHGGVWYSGPLLHQLLTAAAPTPAPALADLTPREVELLTSLAAGDSASHIAHTFHLTPRPFTTI